MTERNVAFPMLSVKQFSAVANHPGLASVAAGSANDAVPDGIGRGSAVDWGHVRHETLGKL